MHNANGTGTIPSLVALAVSLFYLHFHQFQGIGSFLANDSIATSSAAAALVDARLVIWFNHNKIQAVNMKELSVVVLCFKSGHYAKEFATQISNELETENLNYELVLVGNYIKNSNDMLFFKKEIR